LVFAGFCLFLDVSFLAVFPKVYFCMVILLIFTCVLQLLSQLLVEEKSVAVAVYCACITGLWHSLAGLPSTPGFNAKMINFDNSWSETQINVDYPS